MSFIVRYHPDVKKVDLPKIDARGKASIKRAIEHRLTEHPESYARPLRKTLKGYWKLRVGDFRIVFRILQDEILILGIIHRREVYDIVPKK